MVKLSTMKRPRNALLIHFVETQIIDLHAVKQITLYFDHSFNHILDICKINDINNIMFGMYLQVYIY